MTKDNAVCVRGREEVHVMASQEIRTVSARNVMHSICIMLYSLNDESK